MVSGKLTHQYFFADNFHRGTDNEKGTGLGLLLCKTFAEQMGGKITAANDDKGMTFKVWFPVN